MVLETFRRANDFIWDRANGIVFDDVIVNQGDANGRKMRVQVVNRGVVENLTGASLNLAWKAAQGKGLDKFAAVNEAQGIFEISFTKGMLNNVGRLNASLQLILPSGGGIVESRPFIISNQASMVDQDSAQSTDSWTALEQALSTMSDVATKSELQQISLSYKESYATVAELQAAYPNGDVYNHVVLADKMIYTYKNGWINTGIQANGTGIADGTVTPTKTTFIVPSQTLYNKEDSRNIDGKFLNFSVSPATQSNNVETEISHPIKVTPGQKYVTIFDSSYFGVANARAAMYDANGNYIDRSTPVITGRIGVLTMPTLYPQLDHIRISYKKTDKETLMIVNGETYPSAYIPFLSKLAEDITLNNRQLLEVSELVMNDNPLYMSNGAFAGDSIMQGAGDSGRGWPYRIAKNNQMTYTNHAIAGAVFAREVKTSAGANVPSILDQIDAFTTSSDYYLIEGSANDADYNVPMGTISIGFNATLDETTYCGAFESALKKLVNKCHGKYIGYIVAQKMGTVTWQNRRYPYFVKAMEICRKWGVPYLNLWDDFYLNPAVDVMNTAYYVDTQHLKPSGYDLTAPILENWMRDVLPAAIGGSMGVDLTDVTARLVKLEVEKANRKQGEWITPTLLNGVTNYGGDYQVVEFMKDEFGFVHIRGCVVVPEVNTIMFYLPPGFRPNKINRYAVIGSSGTSLNMVVINVNGSVQWRMASTTLGVLGHIIFKAEE